MDKCIAVVGCGFWGVNLVRNFDDLGVLRAVCDSSAEKLTLIRAQCCNVERVFDADAVFANSNIEAVVVATPASTHYELCKKALRAGKDVFVEKPLALKAGDGEELVGMAAEKERILMVGHVLHYHPAVKVLKSLMSDGALGRIQYVYSNRLNFGKIRREENILWSFAPHDISLIVGLLGEEPAEVSARGSNYLHPDIADVTMSQMKFSSGVNAHIFVSWLHPFKEQKLVVVGERQMAVFDDTAPWETKLTLYPHEIAWTNGVPQARKAEGKPVSLERDEPLRAECRHFIECVASRRAPMTDGSEGVRGLRVLNALQASLDQGGITIPLLCKTALSQVEGEGAGEGRSFRVSESRVLSPEYRNFFAHETAIIDEGASVGKGTKVWHFTHVVRGAEIGENCSLGQNVVIMNGAKLGRNVKVQNNVSIFEKVVCEDDVFLGPSMIFTNITNPRSHISRRNEYKETIVRRGATIGANATMLCGNEVGEYAFVGAGSVVTKDIPPYALVYGNPGRINGWVCRCGCKLPVKVDYDGETTCTACRATYRINNLGCHYEERSDEAIS